MDSAKTNKSILEELEKPVSLSVSCEKRIMGYFGHGVRRNEQNLGKGILFGKVPGSRGRR